MRLDDRDMYFLRENLERSTESSGAVIRSMS
jgi:hypothetical protein